MLIPESDWNDLSNYRESLEHYGRKGMHWYQHIFGDEQSHAKYAKGSSDNKKTWRDRREAAAKQKAADKAKAQKAKADKKAAEEKAKAEQAAKKKEEQRKKNLERPSTLYKHRKEYTYDEIKNAITRFEQEKRLSDFSKADLNRGADFIKTMVTYSNNAINLYNTAARVVNSVAEREDGKNVLPFIGKLDDTKNKKTKVGKKDE